MTGFCVYILYSEKADRFYIGETADLDKRLIEHQNQFYENSFTSKVDDWILFLKISCDDRIQARKIESHIKKMKSSKYIQDLKKYPKIILKLKEKY